MDRHDSQRGYFAYELYQQMKENPNIFLLVGDLGYRVFDKHFEDFPDRCINCGASEQAMLGLAVGLALDGKIPFCYTITSFFLRAAETISLYADHESVPIKLVGSGRDDDYKHDGFSHDATRVQQLLATLDIVAYFPDNKDKIPVFVDHMVMNNQPSFISLRR